MIPLNLGCTSEAERPFVTRLRRSGDGSRSGSESDRIAPGRVDAWAGAHGLFVVDSPAGTDLDGDVVAIDPMAGRLERLLRTGSPHNTLLVTERCDQLCVMCSQPPKKTHVDRFDLLEAACLLAEPDIVIGISGGEPTLYKEQLLGMVERVLAARPDLAFHILTNAQHFEGEDIERLRDPRYRRVCWGIPLYAAEPDLHDEIVGKTGAFARLEVSLAHLLCAGARVELRTVLVQPNLGSLVPLAHHVGVRLRFIESWSIMQLENIGFARNRWASLYVDHRQGFGQIAAALDLASLQGIPARLFNFPRCTVPEQYRHLAAASISDWKRKYAAGCTPCTEKDSCTGFFEWHPESAMEGLRPL